MSRINDRFIIIPDNPYSVIDAVEKVSFDLISVSKAKQLCEQLQSMHNTIGVLLEELERLKFPPTTLKADPAQLNAEFDAQELFGESEVSMEIKRAAPDLAFLLDKEFYTHELDKLKLFGEQENPEDSGRTNG